ncbi:hypothetical protein OPV22_018366 [Ensete ventricosum]|uniref:Uncharacterized protein n=1 Tax=Ensete ventricosum TaxID=4639 RepID=A0AAV8QVE9_ENSVE|nr:hypothetical protein OPV22_018366 [Ensete ventricosum]
MVWWPSKLGKAKWGEGLSLAGGRQEQMRATQRKGTLLRVETKELGFVGSDLATRRTARSSPRRHGISSKHSRAVFFFNGSLRFLRTFLGRKEDRRAFTASDAARPTMSFDMFGDVEEHFRRLLKETSSLRMPLSE